MVSYRKSINLIIDNNRKKKKNHPIPWASGRGRSSVVLWRDEAESTVALGTGRDGRCMTVTCVAGRLGPAARPGRPTRRPGLGPRGGPVPPGSSLRPRGFACYLCTEASRAEPQAVPGAAQEDVPGAEKGPAAARLATPSCCTDSSQGSPRRGPRGPSPRPSPRSCFNQSPRHRAEPTARDVTSGARRHGHSRGSDFQFWTPRGEELPVWGGERGAGSEARRCPDMAAPWPSRVRRGTAVGCLQGGGRSAGHTHSHAHGPSVQPGRRKAAWSTPETHPRWERNPARPPSARTLPAPLSTHPQPGQGQSQTARTARTARTAGPQQQEAESTFQRGGPWAGRGLLTPQPTRPSSVTLFGDASRPRHAGAGFASCTYIQVSRANPVFTQCLLIRAWGPSHRVSQPRVHVCGRARSHTRSVGHAQNGKLRL